MKFLTCRGKKKKKINFKGLFKQEFLTQPISTRPLCVFYLNPFRFLCSSQSLFQSLFLSITLISHFIPLLYFLLIQTLIHTHSCIQTQTHAHLPSVYILHLPPSQLSALPLTLQSGSLVLPLERFGLSPLFLSDRSSFGYRSRAEFRLGLSRLWREAFINPQLPCCWFSRPV